MMEVYLEDYAKEEADEFEYLYHTIETIASGSFGTVIKAIDLKTQKEVAVKIIMKDKHSHQTLKQIEEEVQILKRLNHKHIVSFETFMETKRKMYIVMEYLGGGTLHQYFQNNSKTLTEDKAKKITSSLLSAVNYLHQRDICHRDIKPENIMLKNHNDITSIKLVDFGLSSQFFEHKEEFNFCGTLLYIAPEQIQNKTYSKGIDIWSVGIVLFKLLNEGKHPLWISKDSKEKYITKLKNQPIEVFNQCSKIALSFLMKLLERNPCFRYTAQNALDHPWITGRKYDPIPKTVFEGLKEKEMRKKMLCLFQGSLFALYYRKQEEVKELKEKEEEVSQEYEDKLKETNVFYHELFIKERENNFSVYKKEKSPYSSPRSLSPLIKHCVLYKVTKTNSQKDISFKEKTYVFNQECKYIPSINSNSNINNNNNNSNSHINIKGKKSLIRKVKTSKINNSNSYPFTMKNSINIYSYNSKQIVKAHIKNINSFKKNSFIEDELRVTMTPLKERKRSLNDSLYRLNIPMRKTPEPKTNQVKHLNKIVSKFSMLLPKIKG